MASHEIHHYIHFCDPCAPTGTDRILSAVGELRNLIMTNQTELLAQLTAIGDQTNKVFNEVSAQLASLGETIVALQEALANSSNVDPAIVAKVAEMAAQVQAIDDLIPDAG